VIDLHSAERTASGEAVTSLLPADRVRVSARAPDMRAASHAYAGPTCVRILASASAHGCAPEAEWLAVMVALLGRYSRDDIVTLSVSPALCGFVAPEAAPGIRSAGARISVDMSGDPDLRTATELVRNAVLTADTSVPPAATRAGVSVACAGEAPVSPDAECAVVFSRTDDAVGVSAMYDAHLFDTGTIQRWFESGERLLHGALSEPRRALSRLPIVSDAERERMLQAWNDTTVDRPGLQLLHQLIEAQAVRTPDAVAVEFERRHLTYASLNRAANVLAGTLIQHGVEANAIIAVSMARALELPVALLAILKAGGSFLPLDLELPRDRIRFKLEDAAATLLLTQDAVFERMQQVVESLPVEVMPVPTIATLLAAPPAENPGARCGEDDRAYVMYTSGSTGRPKGVEIVHRAICNHAQWFATRTDLTVGDRMLLHASLSFDAAMAELFAPLCCGATVVCAPPNAQRDLLALPGLLRTKAITVVQMVPSALRVVANADGFRHGTTLRYLVSGGEALDAALCRVVRQQAPTLRLGNFYGPTEVTVDATSYEVPPDIEADAVVPIGSPVANAYCLVLDPHGGLVPIGVPGELHVGGTGLARGYLNLPERTSTRFSVDPYRDGGRLYHTGDLVRYRSDGTIEYLGRIDTQVKLRGYRIELAEVEAPLLLHPHVRQAAATLRDDDGEPTLVAYVVPDPAHPPTPTALRELLRSRVPSYMVPATVMLLDALPTLANGKLDRRALPAPPRVEPDATDAVLMDDPLEQSLQAIWERTLGVRPIGPDDDFFALGGHSLKAIRVLAAIEERHRVALRAATLFEAPTIRALAARMRDTTARDISTLIPVQPRGTATPLFFAPGGGGELFVFEPLARAIGLDQPFYVLDMYVFDELGLAEQELTLADVAARMIADMKRVQPHGPYQLAGYSLGGNIVFEMAQQLTRAGEAVHLVTLIDCDGPNYPYMQPFITRAAKHVQHALSLGPRGTLRYLRDRVRNLGRYVGVQQTEELHLYADQEEAAMVPAHVIAALEKSLTPVLRAWEKYLPKFYAGDVLLIRANTRPFMVGVVDDDPLLGWGPVVGGIRTEAIDGDHLQIVNPQYAERLAELLRPYLFDQSRRTTTSAA
jgi:amino acid adenylation domain-containing protein